MDMMKKVPVREQEPAVRQEILKRFVWDTTPGRPWQRHPAA